MRTANPHDYLVIDSAEPVAPLSDAASYQERLADHRQYWARSLERMRRRVGTEMLIDHFDRSGWPDLDTPPPLLTPEQRVEQERMARDWGAAARAELLPPDFRPHDS